MKQPLAFLLLPVLAAAAYAQASPSGVDLGSMNRSVDPCVDFYQYACGTWLTKNPLPADRARYVRFTELSAHNERVLLDILQGAAASRPNRSALDQKIGDAYASCMDTAAIEKKGAAPLKEELDRINAIHDAAGIAAEVARLQSLSPAPTTGGGGGGTGGALFAFNPQPDAKDSSRTIANVSQGGLSLPDRDYYLRTEQKWVDIRQRYLQHVARMFQLTGDSAESAAAKAKMVLDFETAIARASADRASLRDPAKNYHIMTRAELQALMPDFDWTTYLKASGAPAFETLNVAGPDFLKQIQTGLHSQPMEAWRAYLAFREIRANADRLPAAFEDESFEFWQHYLAGIQQPRPREMRCVQFVDRELGDLLGQKYIELAFSGDAKTQITQLVGNLEQAMGQDIQSLSWMTPETRKAAVAKLAAITNNVGVPKKWRDYSGVTIARDDLFGNAVHVAEARHIQRMARIGQPTDKSEWSMTTPTVNAFYSPSLNSINFPAGILQEPFFDPRRDMAVNYGAIGAVIGHEMTHGFDDQGRKYDGDGNLRDWWTAADGAEFEKRAACVANEYSNFTAVDDIKLNGRLTLGENTADNGGLRIAYMALENALKGNAQKQDGFTPEQRFFIGFGQIWCGNTAPQESRNLALTDPHSPGQYRANGTVQNMPEFQKAFACKAGQPMVSTNACHVW